MLISFEGTIAAYSRYSGLTYGRSSIDLRRGLCPAVYRPRWRWWKWWRYSYALIYFYASFLYCVLHYVKYWFASSIIYFSLIFWTRFSFLSYTRSLTGRGPLKGQIRLWTSISRFANCVSIFILCDKKFTHTYTFTTKFILCMACKLSMFVGVTAG